MCNEKQNCFHSSRHDGARFLISPLFPISFSPSLSWTFPLYFLSHSFSPPFSNYVIALPLRPRKKLEKSRKGMTKRLATPNMRNIPTRRVIFPRQLTLRRAPSAALVCWARQTNPTLACLSLSLSFGFVVTSGCRDAAEGHVCIICVCVCFVCVCECVYVYMPVCVSLVCICVCVCLCVSFMLAYVS